MCSEQIYKFIICFILEHGSKKILKEWNTTKNLKEFEKLWFKNVSNIETWKPIEGVEKKKNRKGECNINTTFSRRRADHRNAILKDWAKRLELTIEPKVPKDYKSPFDKSKCVYCLSPSIGPTGDEFRPSTQRGRQNKINCVSCCGKCNSSKQDKCGTKLIEWIKSKSPAEQYEKIIKWYQDYEKYMLIPENTIDPKNNKTYKTNEEELDERLNKIYEDLM